ncbi:MAG: hypothetical protein HWE23_12365 [Rhodobacteraceae bacterium]|nr:hypothetical protein [Paracoccaceae bacterium]
MKHLLRTLLSSILLTAAAHASAAEDLAGYDRLDVHAAHRASPVAASIWYPLGSKTYRAKIGDNMLFEGTLAYVGAGVKEGKYPLILLSHGSGGNMDGLGWLSSQLALKGAIVLAVNHPGSTSGDSSPRRSSELGKRAKDLSAALDQVLADPAFNKYIDRSRISSAGFSLGGGTALNLAGIQFDNEAFADYCAKFSGTTDDCIFLAKGDVTLENMSKDFAAYAKDPRVSRTIAFDPGLTFAAKKKSMTETDVPTLFITLGTTNMMQAADVGENGSGIVDIMPNAQRITLAPAHHFTFLAECKEAGIKMLEEEEDDPICTDPEGVERADVHRRIIDAVADFLKL